MERRTRAPVHIPGPSLVCCAETLAKTRASRLFFTTAHTGHEPFSWTPARIGGGSLYDSVRYNFIAPLSGTPHVLSDLACPNNFFSLFIANERSANDFSTSNNTYITYGVSHRTPKIKYYCAFQKTSVGWGKIFGTPLERNMFCFGIRNLRNVGRR